MSSMLGILCLHVDMYASSFVFQPCTVCTASHSMCPRAWYDSLDTTLLKDISLLGIYLTGFKVRCLYGTHTQRPSAHLCGRRGGHIFYSYSTKPLKDVI